MTPPNNINDRCSPWLPLGAYGWAPIAEGTAHLGHRTEMTQEGSDLRTSFLWSSFHSSKKYHASCQGREAIKQSYSVATPVNT